MWNNQENNMGKRFKLVVYYYPDQPEKKGTFHAFLAEELKLTAVAGLTKRILQKHVLGKYKTAIFYDNETEIERWEDGMRK